MTTVALHPLGGFGNQLFRYAFARALCEQNGYELRTDPWVGEQIFDLDGHRATRPDGTEDIVIDEYRQAQKDLIYTRRDCRRWFRIKPEHLDKLVQHSSYWPHAHFRRGDYVGLYPIISRQSVDAAVAEHQFPGDLRKNMIPGREYISVSDEHPLGDPDFTGNMAMLPDFYRLMRAPILFRANSSFSWWAATLGHGRVFSPIITGLTGGMEHDNVPYVEGNWPRLAGFEFTTDLHLPE